MALFESLSFRLALIYASLFLASVSLLLGIFYWTSIVRPVAAIKADIRAEAVGLIDNYNSHGEAALVEALRRRAYDAAPRQGYHAFLDRDGSAWSKETRFGTSNSTSRFARSGVDKISGGK